MLGNFSFTSIQNLPNRIYGSTQKLSIIYSSKFVYNTESNILTNFHSKTFKPELSLAKYFALVKPFSRLAIGQDQTS